MVERKSSPATKWRPAANDDLVRPEDFWCGERTLGTRGLLRWRDVECFGVSDGSAAVWERMKTVVLLFAASVSYGAVEVITGPGHYRCVLTACSNSRLKTVCVLIVLDSSYCEH